MLERDGYMPGVPCWIDTGQPDPEAAVAFYGGLFGWEFEDVMPPGSPSQVLHRSPPRRRRGRRRVAARGRAPEAAWNTYVWVHRADDAAARVRDAGGTVVMEPFDVMSAGRMAVLADPEGAAFRVWQAGDHKGAQIVNEPGTLNFNGLNTRDARRREVLLRLGVRMGDARHRRRRPDVAAAGLRRIPRASDPGLRERMAEVGAPDGFADVVGDGQPAGATTRSTSPHTGV